MSAVIVLAALWLAAFAVMGVVGWVEGRNRRHVSTGSLSVTTDAVTMLSDGPLLPEDLLAARWLLAGLMTPGEAASVIDRLAEQTAHDAAAGLDAEWARMGGAA